MTQNTEQNSFVTQISMMADFIRTGPSGKHLEVWLSAHIRSAEARGAEEQRRKDAEGSWRPMSDAPRNRTPILVKTVPALERKGERWSGWANRYLVVQHEGVLDSGFDMGWSVACPVGYGGLPDDWFVGWKPVDFPANVAALEADATRYRIVRQRFLEDARNQGDDLTADSFDAKVDGDMEARAALTREGGV